MTHSGGPTLPVIPGVVLEEEIGRGGYATVYRAHQTSVNRKVAVKVDDRRLTDDRDRRRFEREITAMGRVSAHPHIVTLYDGGTTVDNRPYLVMELCTGGSYGARITQSGPVPLAEVLDLGFGIADALVAAHEEGILHRDIKPGNILITRYGTPALGDFGLAALGGSGEQPSVTLESLTPSYAAPEAFELRPPTAAGDVYSLGATLYALLQGRPPRSDATGTPPTIPRLLMLLHEPLPPLEAPGTAPIMSVIWRATAADPAHRYGTAAELRDALAAARLGTIDRRAIPPRPGPVAKGRGSSPRRPHQGVDDRSGVRDLSGPGTDLPTALTPRPARPRWLWPALVAAAAVFAVLAVVIFGGSAGDPVRSGTAPGVRHDIAALPSPRVVVGCGPRRRPHRDRRSGPSAAIGDRLYASNGEHPAGAAGGRLLRGHHDDRGRADRGRGAVQQPALLGGLRDRAALNGDDTSVPGRGVGRPGGAGHLHPPGPEQLSRAETQGRLRDRGATTAGLRLPAGQPRLSVLGRRQGHARDHRVAAGGG